MFSLCMAMSKWHILVSEWRCFRALGKSPRRAFSSRSSSEAAGHTCTARTRERASRDSCSPGAWCRPGTNGSGSSIGPWDALLLFSDLKVLEFDSVSLVIRVWDTLIFNGAFGFVTPFKGTGNRWELGNIWHHIWYF